MFKTFKTVSTYFFHWNLSKIDHKNAYFMLADLNIFNALNNQNKKRIALMITKSKGEDCFKFAYVVFFRNESYSLFF